jgi:hypothetical protein
VVELWTADLIAIPSHGAGSRRRASSAIVANRSTETTAAASGAAACAHLYPRAFSFFLWLVVSVETPKEGRFAIETLNTPVHTPMDNLFDSSRRSVSSYKTYRVVVVVVIVARARTNFEDTHTRTRSFICLVAIVAQIPQTLEERIFFFSLSLSERIIITDTYVDITKER